MSAFDPATFRLKRDAFQRARREQVLPELKAQLRAFEAEIAPLDRQWRKVDKHHKAAVEFELKPLWFKRQDTQADISAIEGEMWIPYALGFKVKGVAE